MIAQDELRHRLEHRDLDGLPLSRPFAMNDRGEHGRNRAHADKPIDERKRHIARLFRAHPHSERRQRAKTLHQIVIGRTTGVGARFAEADQARVNETGIDGGQIFWAEF